MEHRNKEATFKKGKTLERINVIRQVLIMVDNISKDDNVKAASSRACKNPDHKTCTAVKTNTARCA